MALGRNEADLSKPDVCANIIKENSADVIINAAAYTLVDQAETEIALANIINGESPSRMAEAAALKNIPFIHISTDYVFDGHGQESWKPGDKCKPLNTYGRSKLNGEEGVCTSGGSYVILRTSWVFSAYGHNFVKTMLHLSETDDNVKIVEDQIGGPTAASDVAKTCLIIAQTLYSGREVSGTYHFSGSPDVSWADFAREIFVQAGRETVVQNISTSEFPKAVRRPLNSRMNCFTLNSVFGIERPNWRESLNNVLKDLEEI
jgi:dTDP-4-dehydrorhamnose reductase